MGPWGPWGWRERRSLCSGTSSASSGLTPGPGDGAVRGRVLEGSSGRECGHTGHSSEAREVSPRTLPCLSSHTRSPPSWGTGREMSRPGGEVAWGPAGGVASAEGGEWAGRAEQWSAQWSDREPGRWAHPWSQVEAGQARVRLQAPLARGRGSQVESGRGFSSVSFLDGPPLSVE